MNRNAATRAHPVLATFTVLILVFGCAGEQSTEVSTVKVFRGGDATPTKTYYRTWNDSQRGWHVFDIDAGTGAIIDVNQVLPDVPDPHKMLTK